MCDTPRISCSSHRLPAPSDVGYEDETNLQIWHIPPIRVWGMIGLKLLEDLSVVLIMYIAFLKYILHHSIIL